MITFIAQIALQALNLWMTKNAKDKAMIESYYAFLKQLDISGDLKVKQYLSAEESLIKKQNELKGKK